MAASPFTQPTSATTAIPRRVGMRPECTFGSESGGRLPGRVSAERALVVGGEQRSPAALRLFSAKPSYWELFSSSQPWRRKGVRSTRAPISDGG